MDDGHLHTVDPQLLEAALESLPVGLAILDADLQVVRANRAFCRLAAASEGDCTGRRLEQLLELDDDARAALDRVFDAGAPEQAVEVLGGDRRVLHAALSEVEPRAGERAFACLLHDVTGVVTASRRLQALQDLTAELSRAVTQEQVTELVLGHGRELVDASSAAAALLVGDELVSIGMEGFGDDIARGWQRFPLLPATPMSDAVRSGEAVFLESDEDRERLYPHLPNVTGLTLGVVPVSDRGRVIGALAFRFGDRRRLGAEDRALMRTLGEHYGQALDRARLFEAADSERRRLDTLMRQLPVGVAIAEAPSGHVIAVNERATHIWRVPPAGPEPITDVSDIVAYRPDGSRYGVDDWPLARSLATGEVVDDEEVEAVFGDGTRGYVSISARPILDDGGRLLGAVTTLVDVTEHRRREEAARFVAEATDLLAESLDPDETLRRLAQLAVPRLADWCTVSVRDDGEIRSVAVAHSNPARVEQALQFERRYPPKLSDAGGVAAVIRTGRSTLTPEITSEMLERAAPDPEWLRMISELGLCSVVTVPLTARGRTFGAIALVSAESRRRFTPEDVAFAEDFATHAALAVDNARLYRERSRIATTLQASLFPPTLPAVAGLEVGVRYQAGGEGVEVGGDFYDLFPAGDGRYGIVVGDVCGKGAPAAALTALTRHTIRASAMRGDDPRAVAGAVNRAILAELASSELRFCTAAIGCLEPVPEGFSMELLCAGHPRPLVRRVDGRVELPETHGTLLGVYSDPVFHPARVLLRPGERMVVFTDGLADAWREGGEERIAALVAASAAPPDELAGELLAAALSAHGGRPADDIAILVVGVS